MNKLTIDKVKLQGKRVLMRVDFNVPLKDGVVTDDTRIRSALPSIKKVIDEGGKLILMSHLGRPKGEVKPELSLKPAAERLSDLLGKYVAIAPDCIGSETSEMVSKLNNGDVLLLENLRYHLAETKNDEAFSKELASFADVYINDAFGTAHRAHASTAGVTQFIDICAAGYLMTAELESLGRLLHGAEKPYVAILGGAKVSDKIEVINNLLGTVNNILIGGGMAYTFLKTQNHAIGNSLLEEDKIDVAQAALEKAGDGTKVKINLPVDHVVATGIDAESCTTTSGAEIAGSLVGVDVGPKTIEEYVEIIKNAKTIFWNGPMGVFENPAFSKGTLAIAQAVAEATDAGAFSVVGGGDSVSALNKSGLSDKISHVSTGGGASLEFMTGKILPGVDVLNNA
ncbi:MAG: phosphoglycerate kinase [Deferribacteres bacterium]|nr:phosphoglycerate kinase [candidate division KSB1 bacterium]MCB9501317.1 phosphoglycerate kinase [Deferribacteres bacterium]